MRKDPILYTSWLTFILQYCIKVCQMIKIELDYFQSCNSVTNLTAKQHNRWNTELEVLTKWLTYFGIRVQSAGGLSATVFGRTIHSSPSVFGSESVESRDLYKAGHQRLGLVVHPPHALLASCSHPPYRRVSTYWTRSMKLTATGWHNRFRDTRWHIHSVPYAHHRSHGHTVM